MNVSTLVFLGLAVVWAIVLVPEVLRKLSGVRSSDTIRSFNQQLAVLDRSGRNRTPGRSIGARPASNVIDLGQARSASASAAVAPRPVPYSVRRRRQEILTVLAAAAVLTLLCTVAFGGAFLFLHLFADALLVAYVVLLAQATQNAPVLRAEARSDRPAQRPVPADRMHAATVGRAMPTTRRIAN
jgi:hypothetical protein